MDQCEALSMQLRQNGQHWFECAGQGERVFYIIINIHVTTFSWRGPRREEHPAIEQPTLEQPTCSISPIAVQMHWRFFPHEIWLFNQRRILRFKKCRLRMLRCNPCMPLLQVFLKIYSHLNSTIENREDWAQRISLKHTILMSSIGRVHAQW